VSHEAGADGRTTTGRPDGRPET